MRIGLILLLLIVVGCSNRKETSEPSTQDLTALTIAEGDKIASAAQKALGGQLKKAITEGGPLHAVQFCNTAAYPILDTLTTNFNVAIKRASHRVRNPNDEPTSTEKKILEQFSDQLMKGEKLVPVVEILNEKQMLYAKPILLNNPLCLNCHGEVGAQVLDDTHELIQELYPEDNAIGHKLGDLRGIWSITFEKDELVDYLDKMNTGVEQGDQKEEISQEVASKLLASNCYVCHNPNSKSHDEILAPPLAGIKMRYQRATSDREAFITKMTSFVSNPSEESALMHGPVRRFGLMPKTALSDKEISEIVTYISDNELPRPEWFEGHHGR